MCNAFTTGGLICLAFYRYNGYLVLVGFTLVAIPSVYYSVSSMWLASYFPSISGLVVVVISGFFNSSGGEKIILFKTWTNFKGPSSSSKLHTTNSVRTLSLCCKSWLDALFLFGFEHSPWLHTRKLLSYFGFSGSLASMFLVSKIRRISHLLPNC